MLNHFWYDSTEPLYMAFAFGSPNQCTYVTRDAFENLQIPHKNAYFGPALRNAKSNLREAVAGTIALWTDVDDTTEPDIVTTLPPSFVVHSGHGFHVYWLLEEPLTEIGQIESLNQILAVDTGGDHCWNANRILRIPGTLNMKPPQASVRLLHETGLRYTPDDIQVLSRLDERTRNTIKTGSREGFRSRSERDWFVVKHLCRAGAQETLIRTIFANHLVGDKCTEVGKAYLDHTLEKALLAVDTPTKAAQTAASTKTFRETPEGYFVDTQRNSKRVSTFTFHPTLLLDGSMFGSEDALVGTVKAGGYEWPGRTLTKSAFTGISKLDREMPVAAWQWIGNDHEVRTLLPYLLDQLVDLGLPRVAATPVIGLHKIADHWYFVGTSGTLDAETYWPDQTGPIAWLPSPREHPDINLADTEMPDPEFLRLLKQVNEPEVLWPAIGWYTASLIKPWIEAQGYRFPVLSVAGTRGSGKTTLIQRVLLPIFGQAESKSYDAGTTRFVILALLGSANALPVAFSEFRAEYVERFLRYVLLAYDTGHDPRGRADQSTVDYALSAPFTLDGEDVVEDPAARERIVAIHLKPETVSEGSPSYMAYNQLRNQIRSLARPLLQSLLKRMEDGTLRALYDQARADMFEAYPSKLPDRVRNNHSTVLFGAYAFCSAFGMDFPAATSMRRSIEAVFNLKTGRAQTLVDGFIEEVVNQCAQGDTSFKWTLNNEASELFFQLTPTHGWWVQHRRRQGRAVLERDTIKAQLSETPYALEPRVIEGAWMYGINLKTAQEIGLDIPTQVISRVFRF